MNIAILQGRLTRDPEIKITTSGSKITSFTLAIDRGGKSKETDFIDCKAWGKTEPKKTAPTPKASVALICERCGKPISSAGKFPASKVAESTKAQFGKQMCFDCGKATKAEQEKPTESVVMEDLGGLPFPIED